MIELGGDLIECTHSLGLPMQCGMLLKCVYSKVPKGKNLCDKFLLQNGL